MPDDNLDFGIVHTFSNGLRLEVGEIASGQFGWWIDTPESEKRTITFGSHPSAIRFNPPSALLEGESPTFDGAVKAGKKAWEDRYGTTQG